MNLITADQAIPTKQSTDADWVAYYDLLPGNSATKNALFMKTWTKYGSPKANTNSLRSYLQPNGINLSTNGIGTFVDGVYGVRGTLSSALTVGYVGAYILGGIVFVTTIAIIIKLATPQNVGIITGVAAKTYTGKK